MQVAWISDFHRPGCLPNCYPSAAGSTDFCRGWMSHFHGNGDFTADVAHELRTPIAELRTLAEVALRWPEGSDARQNLREALQIASRMQNLVHALLAITRCEAGVEPVRPEQVDLVSVVREAWKPFAKTADDRSLVVGWDLPESAIIQSDPAMLESLLANVVSNATAHSPAGGHVDCRLSCDDTRCDIFVSNSCQGLSRRDLSRMFEPFWRGDPARSGGVHCGLGLSLVSAYANALGCSVDAELSEDKIFRIHVEIPRQHHSTSTIANSV